MIRLLVAAALACATTANADPGAAVTPAPVPAPPGADQTWSAHVQATYTWQYHPFFPSPYQGPNSLDPRASSRETSDFTLFLGRRLWQGGALYVDPEAEQGFGLSNTLGVAAFPSGEAYKVGSASPYVRMQRLFLRQTFDLGGAAKVVAPDENQLGGLATANRLTLTLGKFSVTDVFDTNTYAHDPKKDFLNWAVIDAGAFDYAADAWGYSNGVAAELALGRWTARAGVFNLSDVPNSPDLGRDFDQFEAVTELEERHSIGAEPGSLRVLGWLNRGRMGSYADALTLAGTTRTTPSTAAVRRYTSRPGVALNFEQQLPAGFGLFGRWSANDGSEEAYEFTEINRSLSLGAVLDGAPWHRPGDRVGLAGERAWLSDDARAYFAAGGLGILIGDGRLPRYGSENVAEFYYSAMITPHLILAMDYQRIGDPAYNRDRGPVAVTGLRLHTDF